VKLVFQGSLKKQEKCDVKKALGLLIIPEGFSSKRCGILVFLPKYVRDCLV